MAAEQHIWISSTGVWSSTSSWDTGEIPGHGGLGLDTALFDGTSNVSVIGETPGGNALGRLITTPKYRGDIAAPGNPLDVAIFSANNNGQKAIFRGRGNVYYKGAVSDVVVDTGTFDRVVSLDGALRQVFIKSGKVELTSTVSQMAALYVLSASAFVTIEHDGIAVPMMRITDGTVDNKEGSFTNIQMLGGHLVQRGLMRDTLDVVMRGGWLEYKPTLSISGHNPDLFLLGGTFDLQNLTEELVAADQIIGPGAAVIGNLSGVGAMGGGSGIVIDLRGFYP